MNPHFPEEFWHGRRSESFDTDRLESALESLDWQNRLSDDYFEIQYEESAQTDQLDDGTLVSVPENYEAKYAYPLIVWLCRPGQNEHELLELTQKVDSRNYLGMAFPLKSLETTAAANGHWEPSESELEQIAGDLKQACCRMRTTYNLHTERVYLAGFGDAATVALELVLQRPEWYAGAMLFGGAFPRCEKPLTRFRDLPGKRVMIGADAHLLLHSAADMARTGRMLHRAGIDVSTRVYDSSTEVTPQMLADINHWIMGGIAAGV